MSEPTHLTLLTPGRGSFAMPTNLIDDPDTVYRDGDVTLYLRPRRHNVAGATLPDDGIIDRIAVDRFLAGQRVALSPREVLCVVARLAADGVSDERIAERFGRTGDRARRWIFTMRKRYSIGHIPAHDDAYLCRILVDSDARARASQSALIAAGIVA